MSTNEMSAPGEDVPDVSFLELLALAKAQDADAIEELCSRFYPRVQRMVHGDLQHDLRVRRPWLHARFSTGDVVQEVFRSVLKDLSAFGGRTEGAFVGYLTLIVRNRLIDAVRFHQAAQRDGRRPALDADSIDVAASGGNPHDAAVRGEEMEQLQIALETLPAREGLLVRARLEGTASFQALADQLGYASSSAARRAFYAAQAEVLLKLRER